MEVTERTTATSHANHLCVIVHGLWGNPQHMSYIESTLRDKYSHEKIHILTAKANSGNSTYDGIELGAERVTQETESFLEELEKENKPVEKFSIVGYSLGGLVARYVIGLLYSKGWFSKIEPINFTTFATPHLGVRTPTVGVPGRMWNILGSRTLSTSGRQLFIIDSFRNTQRPILSILADPNSIFIKALSRFKHRVLYANITNDRSAPYYTTSVSRTDPFINLDALTLHYLPSYSPNILDPSNPFSPKDLSTPLPLYTRLANGSQAFINGLPVAALFSVFIPVATVVYLINSGIQSVRSQQRIRLHESGRAGIGLGGYRIPLMVENARNAVIGSALENINAARGQEYLPETEDDNNDSQRPPHTTGLSEKSTAAAVTSSKSAPSPFSAYPTLALTDEQFAMIDSLDHVGFRKYLVHIHKVRHSHAAIIVRSNGKRSSEGKVVVRHWLEEQFEI